MTSNTVSKRTRVISYIVSAVPVLMLLFSAVMKLIKPAGMDEGMRHIGWEMGQATGLAILEIACTVLYLIPRTAILGAILVTAYLGGAIATHVRVGDPFYVQVVLGVLVWLGLWLRDPRLKALLPVTR